MIRKLIYTVSFLLALQVAMAQKQTTITCRIHNNFGQSVSLYKVENGEARKITFRWPKENDSCVFSFPLEKEAVFFVSKGGGRLANFNHVIYLKPGEDKIVDAYSNKLGLDFDSFSVVKPNTETELLQKWANLFGSYCKLGSNQKTREQFITGYSDFVKQAESLKKKSISTNKYFSHLFASKIDAEIKYPKAAAFFYFAERMNYVYDTSVGHKEFYQSLSNEKFCDAGLLQSEHGMDLLNYYLTYNLFQKLGDKKLALSTSIVDKAKSLCNDTVRGTYVIRYMMGVTNYEQFVAEIDPFKTSFVTPEMRTAYQWKFDELTKYSKGIPAYNFSLNDNNDKLHSLSDYKGKVVVLDMWAMWCAPCLAEKPYFKKIEEEYKDRQDIVFLGVSVDGYAKKDVWKKFIDNKGWQGIELLSNFDESIMKYYKIEGIPRFMIFDKEGKIITVDAPRPSTSEFKTLIEQTLKSNS